MLVETAMITGEATHISPKASFVVFVVIKIRTERTKKDESRSFRSNFVFFVFDILIPAIDYFDPPGHDRDRRELSFRSPIFRKAAKGVSKNDPDRRNGFPFSHLK